LLKASFDIDILDLDLKEVARQMTLIDHELFSAIPLHTLFGKAWSKPRHTHSATEIRRFIDRFNATSLWAVRSVLQFGDVKTRADTYVRLVKLAMELEHLNNFSALMAVISGLRQASITRLTNTLAAVGKQWQNHVLSLQQIMSEARSYSMYRQRIESRLEAIQNPQHGDGGDAGGGEKDGAAEGAATAEEGGGDVRFSLEQGCTGIVPHLGVHLQDLTFIEDGNPEHLPDRPYMTNLVRLRMVCGTIKKLKTFQDTSYTLEAVRQLQAAINFTIHQHVCLCTQQSELSSKQLFDRSKQLEPSRS
jgi:son of sevenless-like protein